MPRCKCDCGKDTVHGNFMPGHDQRLRTKLEQKVGGLLNLKKLVDYSSSYSNNEIPMEDFKAKLNGIFNR